MSQDQISGNQIPAVLIDDTILATGPQAISLYNKGHYGIPEKDGVRLNGFEALHLLELGRIIISKENKPVPEDALLSYFAEVMQQFTVRYFVYKDLRNRGYVVNVGSGSSFFFRLYARNTKPKSDGAKYYVTSLNEGGSIPLNELKDLIKIATQSSKILLIGMVDATGDVSYLQVTEIKPKELEKQIFSDFSDWDWEKVLDEYDNWE